MLRSDRHARPESALTADNPFFQPADMDFDMPARGGGSNTGGVIAGGSRTSAPSTSNPHAVSGRPQSMTGKSSVPLAGAPTGVNRLVDTSVSHSPVLGMAPGPSASGEGGRHPSTKPVMALRADTGGGGASSTPMNEHRGSSTRSVMGQSAGGPGSTRPTRCDSSASDVALISSDSEAERT